MAKTTKSRKKISPIDPLKRKESIRLSTEIHGYVQPLRDWYQFTGRNALARFLADTCDSKEVKVTYGAAKNLIMRGLRYDYGSDLISIHSRMRRLMESAQGGNREKIDDFHAKDSKKKYTHPNNQPLEHLLDDVSFKITGNCGASKYARKNLDRNDLARNPSSLVDRVRKEYGFASTVNLSEFLAHTAKIQIDYRLPNTLSATKDPSNYHRKTLGIALLMDYAVRHGMKDKTIAFILSKEAERVSKNKKFVYLKTDRKEYSKLIESLRSKMPTRRALSVVMSGFMGISMENAENDYLAGRNDFMPKREYDKLENFEKFILPVSYVLDLSYPSTRNAELNKFASGYGGKPVLVLAIKSQASDIAQEVDSIREIVAAKIGAPLVNVVYGRGLRYP